MPFDPDNPDEFELDFSHLGFDEHGNLVDKSEIQEQEEDPLELELPDDFDSDQMTDEEAAEFQESLMVDDDDWPF